MRIWITRAEPGAGRTAGRIRALGHDPLVAPVLCVRRLAVDPPDLTGVSAIAFTSANAVLSFAALIPQATPDREDSRRLPVFAVGDATAAQARACGFTSVVSADGDVGALAQAVLRRRSGIDGVVLHPCALEAAGDLAGGLAAVGVKVRPLALYDTVGVAETPDAAIAALRTRTLDTVMVHSPKAAKVLRSLVLRSRLDFAPSATSEPLGLAALSPACAAPLAELDFAPVTVASVPREDVLLRELADRRMRP